MEEKTLREFFVWRISQLLDEKEKKLEHLELETDLNVSRIMRCENSVTDKTKCKVYNFFEVTPDEFHKTFPEFLEEKLSAEIK